MKPALLTAALLTASNLFMKIAWYGHLEFEKSTLWKVILEKWLIAFLEYCLQVPVNIDGARFPLPCFSDPLYVTKSAAWALLEHVPTVASKSRYREPVKARTHVKCAN